MVLVLVVGKIIEVVGLFYITIIKIRYNFYGPSSPNK